MPRLPEHQEGWEPVEEKDEVLEILSNPFKPDEQVLVTATVPARIIRYYKDGFYQVEISGLWEGDLVLYHYSDIKKDPEGDRRNT